MNENSARQFKSGIVTLIGRSNVGKSTLLNAFVGEKIAPVSHLPQTTRRPLHGVLTREEGQIVFVDTPGLLRGPKDVMTPRINESIRESLESIDAILYVADPTRVIGDEERRLLSMVRGIDKPKILVINKVDIKDAEYREDYHDLADEFSHTIEVSALAGKHLEGLIKEIFSILPEGEPLYDREAKTDISREVWISEIIREKLYHHLHKELPYSATVKLAETEERENGVFYIRAIILTTNARYRKMIIGKGASRIKEIGIAARKELALILNKPIYLDLTVEVDPHWQERF